MKSIQLPPCTSRKYDVENGLGRAVGSRGRKGDQEEQSGREQEEKGSLGMGERNSQEGLSPKPVH